MNVQMYLEEVGVRAVTSGLQILLVIIVMVIASRAIHLAVNRGIRRMVHKDDPELQKLADTPRSIINSLVSVLIFGLVLVTILGQLGIAIGPILAAAGVLGLAERVNLRMVILRDPAERCTTCATATYRSSPI